VIISGGDIGGREDFVMKVSDVMTRRVVAIDPAATIADAIKLMLQHHVSGLPVIDGSGRLVGIVTEGDFLRRAETGTERRRPRWLEFLLGPARLAQDYVHTHGRRIDEVMTRDPVFVSANAPLAEAVAVMERRHFKRLPVMHKGKVVGIVSRVSLMHALVGLLRAPRPGGKNDDAIRDHIVAEIDKQRWAPADFVDVVVHDGVVTLFGLVADADQGEALKVLAENAPGVKKVESLLTLSESLSVT
jgi:CBS domain-containing protein